MICFIEEGQDAREHSDAVESMFLRGEIWIWKCWKMSKGRKAVGKGRDEGFEVPEGVIASSADVNWRKEAEDIFSRFWQFPELGTYQHCTRVFHYCTKLTPFQ